MGPIPGAPYEKRESEDKYSDNCDQHSTTYLALAIIVRHAIFRRWSEHPFLGMSRTKVKAKPRPSFRSWCRSRREESG